MQPNNSDKKALDKVLTKSRVHFYKPIQVAEVLYQYRIGKLANLNDLESYRSVSKRWRDEVSKLLIGRVSTSSARFQDNIFEENAILPATMSALGNVNNANNGLVEAYIYRKMQEKFSLVRHISDYVRTATPETFSLDNFVGMFESRAGLKRSMDKVYEITVYALFTSIVRVLRAQITLEILNEDEAVLRDFEPFIKAVLGIDAENTKVVMPAALYRVGVTNAADRGLDMWGNFGSAVQVKHLTLRAETVEEIAGGITADRIVIVCLECEKESISVLLQQVGWGSRIQGIITFSDLSEWYTMCLSPRYREKLGNNLLSDLTREFDAEFPSNEHIEPFMQERGYDKLNLSGEWALSNTPEGV